MDNDELHITSPFTSQWAGFLILLGAIVLVVLVVFVWAIVTHKRKDDIHQHRRPHRRKGIREQFQKGASDIKELVRQHRGQQRERRPINPTIAQTGGLPPRRKTDEPPPPAPQP